MRRALAVTAVVGVVLISGCAQARRGEIPLGHWTGHGELVALRAPQHGTPGSPAGAARLVYKNATYETTLDITRGEGGDTNLLRFEILSTRGPIPGLDGDRTHIILFLEPLKSTDAVVRTYRIVRGGLSLSASPPKIEQGPEGEAHASLMSSNDGTVLQVHYMPGLVDTFRFRGNRLTKDGSYAGEPKEGFIDWLEELTRTGSRR